MRNKRTIILVIFSLITIIILSACGSEAEQQKLDPAAAAGKKLFKVHCGSCHSTSADTLIVGPSLAGIATLAETREAGLTATQYLAISILKPDSYLVDGFEALMPTNFGVKLTGEELDELVIYLLTLTEQHELD